MIAKIVKHNISLMYISDCGSLSTSTTCVSDSTSDIFICYILNK